MSKKDYIVSQNDDGDFEVKRSGASRAAAIKSDLAAAVKAANELASNSGGDVLIRRVKGPGAGQFRSKDSQGNDPPSRRDTEH